MLCKEIVLSPCSDKRKGKKGKSSILSSDIWAMLSILNCHLKTIFRFLFSGFHSKCQVNEIQ